MNFVSYLYQIILHFILYFNIYINTGGKVVEFISYLHDDLLKILTDFKACETTGAPSWKYVVVYATVCVYRELYGKITDRKKIV